MKYNKPSYPLFNERVELVIRALVCYYARTSVKEQGMVKLLLVDLILAQMKSLKESVKDEKSG